MLYPCFIHPTTRSISYIRISVYLFRHAIFSILFYHTGRVLPLPTFSVFPTSGKSQPVVKLCQCFSPVRIEIILFYQDLSAVSDKRPVSFARHNGFVYRDFKSWSRAYRTLEKAQAFFYAKIQAVFFQFFFIPWKYPVIHQTHLPCSHPSHFLSAPIAVFCDYTPHFSGASSLPIKLNIFCVCIKSMLRPIQAPHGIFAIYKLIASMAVEVIKDILFMLLVFLHQFFFAVIRL